MLRIGYWYDVLDPKEKVSQIKLIPSERYLETQAIGLKYYEVLERLTNNAVVSGIIGTEAECLDYINTRYEVKDNFHRLTDRIWSILEELENDRRFLERAVDKKNKEIACHIQDALTLIRQFEDSQD